MVEMTRVELVSKITSQPLCYKFLVVYIPEHLSPRDTTKQQWKCNIYSHFTTFRIIPLASDLPSRTVTQLLRYSFS